MKYLTMEFDIEKILTISLTSMRIISCHSEMPKTFKFAIKIIIGYVIYSMTCLTIFYNIFCINLSQNDFSEACRNSILFITYVAATMKYCTMFRYGDVILQLFKDMKRDLEVANNLPLDERKIIEENVSKQTNVCKLWLYLGVTSCGVFNIRIILQNIYNYIIGDDKLIHLHALIYPKFIDERKNSIYMFLLLYILLFYYGVYTVLIYVAFVPLGPVFVLHASAQLVLVKKRVENLYIDEVDDGEINNKLKDIIQHLQNIYEFVGRISTCMNVFYELTMKMTSILLPITMYEVIVSFKSGNPSFEFITFLFTAIISSSSPCYYGDLLMEKGEEVRQAVYACGWENKYDRSTRSTLMILLQRASQPIIIRTMFRTVCLDALTDVFQQAYGIFNLINTVWE